MLFNSYVYLFLFLPIVQVVYFYLNRKRLIVGAKAWLVFASLFFYAYWKLEYLPLILASIVFNYVIGYAISAKSRGERVGFSQKGLLIFGLLVNIASIIYFKYMDFFIGNYNALSGSDIKLLHIVLPLGISFFTFQQIAYLVDSYKGETKEYDFMSYCLFVSFFPQLIAGPIVHHKEMMPQFDKVRSKVISWKNLYFGLVILSIGLFKKIGIADELSLIVSKGFSYSNGNLNFFESWLTSLAYTFQLYFDFSGYTDMAIGSALMFNIKLPVNFNSPYKALDIQDFWRRWHMTLSRWLKDYLYIPLGGNRKGNVRTYVNLFLTFLICGFWHGAGWTFIVWGALHGAATMVHRVWKNIGFNMNRYLAWFITFNFVNVAWVIFRANDLKQAYGIFKGMLGFNGVALPNVFKRISPYLSRYDVTFFDWLAKIKVRTFLGGLGQGYLIPILLIVMFVTFSLKNSQENKCKYDSKLWLLLSSYFFVYAVFSLNKISEFIYFNF